MVFANKNSNSMLGMRITKTSLAVALAITSGVSYTQETQADEIIDEVVTTGTRLKGSATAVLQERQNQAFVADILGTDQISRTGDSDAASALRRVTGLTLVDGKFIYVRGLGERYSSTQLNGQGVPSPDPTRSVVPLDLFPADVIESLSVQKSYSPDIPAHFGGGNVDIRTKSIPTEFVFKVSAGIGSNSNNSDDGFFYGGGGTDATGRDDGTRGLSSLILNNLERAQSDAGIEGGRTFPLTLEERQQILDSLYWDIGPEAESVDPDLGGSITLGNVFDTEIGTIGFLSAVAYDNSWSVEQHFNGTNLGTNGCEVTPFGANGDGNCFAQVESGTVTEQSITWSGMFNVGYELTDNHRFEVTNIILHDSRDRVRFRDFFDANETQLETDATAGIEFTSLDVLFEERRMNSNQLKGIHNFPEFHNSYFDWYIGSSRARRQAPGGLDATFENSIVNGAIDNTQINTQAAANVVREYEQLRDVVETAGWNFGLPMLLGNVDIEFKIGADFFEKARTADNIEIGIRPIDLNRDFLQENTINGIFNSENIFNDDFYNNADGSGVIESRTSDGDSFRAATTIDAYYFMVDAFIDNTWRISGGVRYEEFRQISIPLEANANTFAVEGEELNNLALAEEEFFPSLALTYILDQEMQFRLNISETVIRPDLRDISTTLFIDPLTEFLVQGSPSLQTSELLNFDARWEWYRADGNNLSVALFYKDIENPIETIELASVGGATPRFLTVNGDTGEVYGVEFEFLQDLLFISDSLNSFYMSGNLTLSESEVTLGFESPGSLVRQQLAENSGTDEGSISTNFVTNDTRRLVGHSEWVVNLQLGYDSDNGEHAATLVYNAFGPRIINPGARTFEDAEEDTFHSLDFIYTYYPNFNSSIKLSVKNILDEEKTITQNGLNNLLEENGISFGLSYSYDF